MNENVELIKQQEEVRRPKPVLEKYVRRHHKPNQIIGDKDSRVMTRRKFEKCYMSAM